jgi:hypothetical protein
MSSMRSWAPPHNPSACNRAFSAMARRCTAALTVAAAFRLEQMGAESRLDGVDAACADLQANVGSLEVALERFVNSEKSS